MPQIYESFILFIPIQFKMDQNHKFASNHLKSIKFCKNNPSNQWFTEHPFPHQEKAKKYNYSIKDLFGNRLYLPISNQDLVSKDSQVSLRYSSVQHSRLSKKRNEPLLNPQPLKQSRKRSSSSISNSLKMFDNSEFFLKSTITYNDLSINQDFNVTPLKKLSINKFNSKASTQDASGKKKHETSQIYYIDDQLEKAKQSRLTNLRASNFSDLFKRAPQPQYSIQKLGQEQKFVCADLFSLVNQICK